MKKDEILISYGSKYKEMTVRLLERADLYGDILKKTSSARQKGKEPKDLVIGIKPNLVNPTPAEFGATTHPEIVAGIIEFLKSRGFLNIRIMEGSWVGDRTEDAFEFCGYNKLKEEYKVQLFDTQKDGFFETEVEGEAIRVCNCVKETDYLINVPVLKGHCQTKITCALKNLKGLIPDNEKRRFHAMGLHRPIALLNRAISQDFIVADNICGDPFFEDGGHPVQKDCIMAAKDPVLLDSYGAFLMNLNKEDIEYLALANKMGVGSWNLDASRLIITEGQEKEVTAGDVFPIETSYASHEIDCCSACYSYLTGALQKLHEEGLLKELKEKICIGQGWKNKQGVLGIGSCTNMFTHNLEGCPPSEEKIYEFIKEYIEKTG